MKEEKKPMKKDPSLFMVSEVLRKELLSSGYLTDNDVERFKVMGNWNDSKIPMDLDEVRKRAIFTVVIDKHKYTTVHNIICFSYVCQLTPMPEKFIEELMFITSNAFDIKWYSERYINIVVDLIDLANKKKQLEMINQIKINDTSVSKDFIDSVENLLTGNKSVIIRDRLDFRNIKKFQNISGEFERKHRKLFPTYNVDRDVRFVPKLKAGNRIKTNKRRRNCND